jgi:hypothetical protein
VHPDHFAPFRAVGTFHAGGKRRPVRHETVGIRQRGFGNGRLPAALAMCGRDEHGSQKAGHRELRKDAVESRHGGSPRIETATYYYITMPSRLGVTSAFPAC